MSLTFKLLSLAIRTAAKPIGNYIKRQAKEHDGFRRFAVAQAQRVHRIDMRMRLGILHDADAQQKMHEREQRAAEERKKKAEAPTVRTEEEQQKYDEEKARREKEGEPKKKKEEQPKVKIRPLSEAKAIELGANFFSEAFIFAVAAGLLVWDSWRSRRKESARRDDVAERLAELEGEVERLRNKHEPELAALKAKVSPPEKKYSWYNPAGWWKTTEPLDGDEVLAVEEPIPGNVPVAQPDKAVKPAIDEVAKPSPTSKATAAKQEAKVVSPSQGRAEKDVEKDEPAKSPSNVAH